MGNALTMVTSRLEQSPTGRLLHLDAAGALVATSYETLGARVEAFRRVLAAGGLRAGHRVGLYGPNCVEWVVADLALIAQGCVSVCLPEDMSGTGELERACARFQIAALVVPSERQMESALPGTFCVESLSFPPRLREDGAAHLESEADTHSLVFSSGTMGTLKCLRMSARGLAHTMEVASAAWRLASSDNVLIPLPFSSVQQRTLVYMSIVAGCDCTVVAPQHLYRALALARASVLVGPPALFEQVERELTTAASSGAATVRAWMSGFRLLFVGSAPSRRSTLDFFAAQGLPLYEVYGMNEFGWIAFNLPGANRTGSVGRPVQGVEARLDLDGELLVRSPAPQTLGYLEASEQERRSVYAEDGWIRTGDLAALADDGYLSLVGRKKNVIIRRTGEKLQPESIEAKIEEIAPYAKAIVFEDPAHTGLVCVVWVPHHISTDDHVRMRRDIGMASRSLAPSMHIDTVLVDWIEKLTPESGLLTRNGKLSRPAVIAHYSACCKGGIHAHR